MCQQHLLEITYHTQNLFRINQRQFEVFIKAATISAWPCNKISVSKKQLFFFFFSLTQSWKTFIRELTKVKPAAALQGIASDKFCLTHLIFSLFLFLCLREELTSFTGITCQGPVRAEKGSYCARFSSRTLHPQTDRRSGKTKVT